LGFRAFCVKFTAKSNAKLESKSQVSMLLMIPFVNHTTGKGSKTMKRLENLNSEMAPRKYHFSPKNLHVSSVFTWSVGKLTILILQKS
jgi:hypothetical protein